MEGVEGNGRREKETGKTGTYAEVAERGRVGKVQVGRLMEGRDRKQERTGTHAEVAIQGPSGEGAGL
jgi:hypothetical protein